MGVELDEVRQQRLLEYLELLFKWNRIFNLTAVRDPAIAVSRQLLDSLAVLPLVRGRRLLDVGSGAGLLGIPLAIARPGWQLVLLDSNSKKTRFLNQVKLELGLENMAVVHDRVERYQGPGGFDTITSRAFSALPPLIELSRHLRAPDGRWVALKGRVPKDEIKTLDSGLAVEVVPLRVPGEKGERHAVVIE
jgi:16S rRNA (guanine527-N7)-methyltransferase